MRKIWMRIGATVELPEEVIEHILSNEGTMKDLADAVKDAFASGRVHLEGETYIPEVSVSLYNGDYGTFHPEDTYECDL